MRNALNSLQATHAGFGVVNDTNVYKVRVDVQVWCWVLPRDTQASSCRVSRCAINRTRSPFGQW